MSFRKAKKKKREEKPNNFLRTVLRRRLACPISLSFPGLHSLGSDQAEGPHRGTCIGDCQELLHSVLGAFHFDIFSSDLTVSQRHHNWWNKCTQSHVILMWHDERGFPDWVVKWKSQSWMEFWIFYYQPISTVNALIHLNWQFWSNCVTLIEQRPKSQLLKKVVCIFAASVWFYNANAAESCETDLKIKYKVEILLPLF